jgi:hypothetical protein
MKSTKAGLIAVLVLLSAAVAVEAKRFTLKKVRGTLEATDEESNARGKFLLGVVLAGDDSRERLVVVAKKLDEDTDYEVLLGEDVDGAVSFGDLRVNRRGYGFLRVKKADFPDDVDSLTDFSGQSVFVVTDDETVLSGDIPEFVDPGTDDEAGDGALAFGYGDGDLEVPADSDGDGAGRIVVAAISTPRGAREMVSVVVRGLSKREACDVYLVSDGADDEKLGSFTARGWFGLGILILDTGRGAELPDHVGELAGMTVEVRNEDGDTVLTGEFPSIE